MLDLEKLIREVQGEGYSIESAEAKVCQDIVLKAIAMSDLNRNITIKGGVVMRSITRNVRRATQDMDLDFIRYSLSDEAIKKFIAKLNCLEGIRIQNVGEIEALSQQEYNGKRAYILIKDSVGYSVKSKIDFGVHKNIQIIQEEYCFDVCLDDEGASLLINSKEQIFAEKLRSLVRFGPFSTRYKDIFDLCYLMDYIDKNKLIECLDTYIFQDDTMREKNVEDIMKRLRKTFDNKVYQNKLATAGKANWLDISIEEAKNKILEFIHGISE